MVGATDDRHVASYTIKNNVVRGTKISARTLGYDVTAVGSWDLSFDPTHVAGYVSLTSLQATTAFKKRRIVREYLYATTRGGALKQIAVPLKGPAQESVKTLRRTGCTGVTELVWTVCNGDYTYTSLTAINPVANTATLDDDQGVRHPSARPGSCTRPDARPGRVELHRDLLIHSRDSIFFWYSRPRPMIR